MKRIALFLLIACLSVLAACNDADVASRNLSTAADNFQISRRIVFYNTVDSSYMMTIEGLCSLGNADKSGELSVTCKVGPTSFKKHFLGLSRNVTYFVEQMDAAEVSPYHYKVVFKPAQIVPDLEVK
jgi:predicted small secreted protein